MKKAVEVIKNVIIAILLLVLAVNIWTLFQRLVFDEALPSVFGFRQAVVLSGSMEPEFGVGDMLIFREQSEYQIDDVVIFDTGSSFTTHRIVGEENGEFITKGDANNTIDQKTVSLEQIKGELVLIIPSIGSAINFLTTPLGIATIVVLAWLVIEIPKFFDKKRENNNEN